MTAAGAVLRCCEASGCRSVGSAELLQALEQAREELGLTAEALTIRPVGCLRMCSRGPLVAADGATGSAELYGAVPPERAVDLVRRVLAAPSSEPSPLAEHQVDLRHPFFTLQTPVVLEG